MSLFRKTRSKSDLHQEYQCTIRFLDDSEPIQVPFTKDTLGQFVLDKVCGTLNLMEKDYFGLRYVDGEKQRHWLDPTKTIYKQLKGVSPCVLCFRVKFYPADPMKLHEEITRYYLFLQLRRDLHHGRLLCSPQDANLLAAYIIQSEVGDYDPQDHPPGYVAEFKMLPKQNIKMEEQIMDIHKTLAGQVPAEAEANFLKKAATLDTYGVDPHQVKDQKGTQLYLGVTHQGIMTFHGSRRTQMYKWSQIKKLAFEGKMFIAHVNINEDEDSNHSRKKHQPVGYKCMTAVACKYLWKCAVEQQFFFTLSDSFNPPKLRSGGSLFSRGSKFRFSGRCQNEAYQASENIKRKEPDFQRTCSLPNFARHMGNKSFEDKARTISQNMPGSIREDLSRKPYNEPKASVTTPVSVTMPLETKEVKKEASEPPRETVKEVPVKPVREVMKPVRQEVSKELPRVEITPVQEYHEVLVEHKVTSLDEIPVESHAESAVDVPGSAEVVQSPVINAPVVSGDTVSEEIQAVQASSVSSANLASVQQNGTIPIIVTPAGDSPTEDLSQSYHPEESVYDPEDDAKAAKSLEDQVLELEKEYERIQEQQQNHVSAVSEDTVLPSTTEKTESLPNNTTQQTSMPAKSKCTCFRALMCTFFFIFLTLTVALCLLMFVDFQQPFMVQMREQLHFLDPVRDYIQHQYQAIFHKS